MTQRKLFRGLSLTTLATVALVAGAVGAAYASHGGSHSGTFTVWSLNEPGRIGNDPGETIPDLSNLSGHLASGPVMITAMQGASLADGKNGNLYWNPATNAFWTLGPKGDSAGGAASKGGTASLRCARV